MMKTSLVATILAALATMTTGLKGETLEFTLDPSRSSITVSGEVVGNKVSEQASGSLTTKVQGAMQVDVEGDRIQFPGGSQLVLQDNGTWQPGAGGASGSAPGNFGAKATALFVTAYASLRNAQLDVTSPALMIAGGSFDSQSLVFGFLTNANTSFDYTVPLVGSGSVPMTGLSTNQITSQATLAASGDTQTLTIPVDTVFYMELLAPNDTVLKIKGQLVATRAGTVVTPSSIGQVSVSGDTVTLQWTAPAGLTFRIESTADFKTWTTRATGIGSTTGVYTWSGGKIAGGEFLRLAQ